MVKVKVEVLKTIMETNNLNQKKLAQVIGVDPSFISRILRNQKNGVGGKFITGLMKYTGMEFDDLFFLDEK
ncbi:MAG: helix-turn-helix transcriptional regulator [Sedimentibacter sp.]|jgi:transcriptional regulator with XRE-family HTH domain|nr:helix-turn-helix transcriptional regulator [Caldisericia bacterium]